MRFHCEVGEARFLIFIQLQAGAWCMSGGSGRARWIRGMAVMHSDMEIETVPKSIFADYREANSLMLWRRRRWNPILQSLIIFVMIVLL